MYSKTFEEIVVLWQADKKQYVKRSTYYMEYVRNHFSFMNLGIYICLCAGLRIGEVCALVWDDIDVEMGSSTYPRLCRGFMSSKDPRSIRNSS